MKATRQFLPRAISPPAVEEPSASTSPFFTFCPLETIGRWWMIVPWLERMNLCSGYSSFFEPAVTTIDSESTWVTSPSSLARVTSPVSTAARRSMPVPISGGSGLSSGAPWRCILGPTRRRSDDLRPRQLAGRRVHLGVGLGDDLVLLLGGVEVDDLFGHDAVLDHAVGRGDKTVLRDLGGGGERADQADVRTLRGLDRAHAAVVGRVDVAHLDRRPLAGEAARAESREAAAVGEAGQRGGLVHELRELRGAE